MSRKKQYVSGADLIAKVKSPQAKTAAFRPFLEPWKKPKVKAKVKHYRGPGLVPKMRQGSITAHI